MWTATEPAIACESRLVDKSMAIAGSNQRRFTYSLQKISTFIFSAPSCSWLLWERCFAVSDILASPGSSKLNRGAALIPQVC